MAHSTEDPPQTAPREPGISPLTVAVVVLLLGAAVSTGVVRRLEQFRARDRRLQVASEAADVASSIQRRLANSSSAAYDLAELIRQGRGGVAGFAGVAEGIMARRAGVAALAVAPGGVISQIAPLAGNEAALGYDLSRDFADPGQYRRAQELGKLTLTGPRPLVQGGEGILVRLPLHFDDARGRPVFWGFVVAVVRIPGALDSLLAPLAQRGLAYQLTRLQPGTGNVQVILSSGSRPLEHAQARQVEMPDGSWTLSVEPVAGYSDGGLLALSIVAAIVFILLLTLVAYLLADARSQQVRLARQVDERTKEIGQAEERLRLAVEGARLGTWYADLTTGVGGASDRCCLQLGLPPGGAIDYDRFLSTVHADDRERLVRLTQWATEARGEFNAEYRVVWPDGTERWIAAMGRVLAREGGTLVLQGVTSDISQRKQAELEARELTVNLERMVEERTADIAATLDAIPDLLFEMDETGVYLDVRSTHGQLLVPREQRVGKNVSSELPADAVDTALAALRAAAENGYDFGRVIRVPFPDGDRWFELSVARKASAGDGPTRLIVLARNITERRRAELAAERTSRALRLMTDCAGALFQAESEDWLLREVCRLSCEVGGYRMAWVGFPEQDAEKTVRPVARWGDTDGFLETAHISWSDSVAIGLGPSGRAMRSGTTQWIADFETDPSMGPWREAACRRGFGSSIALPLVARRSVLGTLTMYASEPNAFTPDEAALLEELAANLAFGLETIRDRARRVAAEKASQAQNDLLAGITDSANDAIVMVDAAGVLGYWNPAAERIFGYTAREALGREVFDLLAPQAVRRPLRDEMSEFMASGAGARAGRTVEAIARRKDGAEIPVAVSASVLTLDGERQVVGVLRDISDLRRYEAELVAAKEAAESAASAKGEFLSNMSHEIRTPMNVILGLAQMLDADTLGPDQRDMVAQIQAAGRILTGVIDDILNFSKLEAGQVQIASDAFDLAALLDRSESLLGTAARAKGLSLSVGTPPDVGGDLVGDDLRLQQVLLNLVGNAIKFTESGQVRVDVHVLDRAGETVRLRFEVGDTGVGIAPDALTKLFTPFTQADSSITRRFGGTGLGLSISKHLVEVMGGRIGADSEPGAGSTFWFELPFAVAVRRDEPPAADRAEAAASGGRLAGLRVLVVDDNHLNRKVIGRLLEREGASAEMAGDGQEALDYLRTHQGAVQAALVDVQMPVMDGLTATRLLRKLPGLARLPVVALSAGVLPAQLREAREAGMDDFLPKPVDLDRMVEVLRRLTAE